MPDTSEASASIESQPSPHPHAKTLVFDSAVDWWLAVLLMMPVVGSAVVGVALLLDNRPDDASVMFLIGAATLAVTAVFTVPCRVTLLDDSLTVRCGLLFWRLPYSTIVRVERSTTWASGPALSLQRVLIDAGRRSVIVSPKNREKFIAELRSRIPSSHQTEH